jgi:hypothetical protein
MPAVMHQKTWTRRRRVLGEDHPQTLASVAMLADELRGLGERKQARKLKKWVKSQDRSRT